MVIENNATNNGVYTPTSGGVEPDSVQSVSQPVTTWRALSKLPRTLLQGTQGMQAASTAYLPQNQLESKTAYANRLSRSVLLNAFTKTVGFLSGQVFQADIIFDDSVDSVFTDLAQQIDTSKNSLDVVGKRMFSEGLGKGVTHFLVDAPQIEAGTVLTVAEANDQGLRPYVKEIHPESVLGGRYNADGSLGQIRFTDSNTVPVGSYGSKVVNYVRVYNDDGSWEIHTLDEDGNTASVESGQLPIGRIPVVTFIPGKEYTPLTGETPLMDLAELNGHHWRSSSDQNNILHVARVPLLFGRHIDVANIPIGTATMVNSEDDNSDLKYVEHSGTAITAGNTDLKETEAQMALYGLQQLIPRSGNMTATEKAITTAESNSSLGTWATEFESVLQEVFVLIGEFVGVEFPDNGLSVNKEYNLGVADPQELAQILKANEQGILSAQATFTEFRRRGVFDEHLSWDDIEADIEQEQRDNPAMRNLAGTTFGDEQ